MKLFNTLTRTVEPVTPMDDNKIKMYTCGLTVYSQPQIGNWVAYIYADVLHRVLLASDFIVERVQNITDVGHLVSDDDSGEDKMEKGARAEGLTAWDVADKYIGIADHEAYEVLHLLRPTKLVRATDLIPQQIAFAQELEKGGFTYVIDGEGVYFDTSKLSSYGQLARLDIEGLQAGARVAVAGKRNVTDFAIWKFSPKNQKRDMEWESPWGKGFPGWHLECSVIARESLGDQIDIHTGGIDHIPVHHTNEIAQTEAITGKQLAKTWFHNNHMKVNGTKLSKSLGNSYTLADIAAKGFSMDAFKLLVLSSHYRTEGNFTWEILEASQNRLKGYEAMADNLWQTSAEGTVTDVVIAGAKDTIMTALQDDLNTPIALSELNRLATDIDKGGINTLCQDSFRQFLVWLDGTLGLNLSDRHDLSDEQKTILARRKVARDIKNWEESDGLRDELLEQGVGINDTADRQVWYRI